MKQVILSLMLILLTILVAEIDQGIADAFKEHGVSKNPLEYPLTAVIVGPSILLQGVLAIAAMAIITTTTPMGSRVLRSSIM